MPKKLTHQQAQKKVAELEEHIAEAIPGFAVRFKDEDKMPWWLKFGWWVMGKTFNKRIWTRVTTTVYPEVWFPSREFYEKDPHARFGTLAHEYVHLQDMKTAGVALFTLRYGMPQIFAALAPLGLFGLLGLAWAPLYWLFAFFGFLVCLIPQETEWRSHYEFRGFIMSLCCRHWSGRSLDTYVPWLVKLFDGPAYWYMGTPDDTGMANTEIVLTVTARGVVAGDFDDKPIYKEVRELWER